MASELLFKRWFRSQLGAAGIWSEAIEPARGGGVGVPDVVALFSGKNFVFFELKIGRLLENGNLKITKIRPAQYSWKRKFQSFGGASCIVVGVKVKGGWKMQILKRFSQDEFLSLSKKWIVKASDFSELEMLDAKMQYFVESRNWP